VPVTGFFIYKIMTPLFSIKEYVLLFVTVFNFVMGFLIFVNDPKNKINISFAFFSFSITLWAATLFGYYRAPLEISADAFRITHVVGLSIAMSLWFFSTYFPRPANVTT
jgi:hypothetical protein